MTALVRPVKVGDLEQISKLYEALNPSDPPITSQHTERLSEILNSPGLHMVGNELNGVLISCATLVIIPNLSRAARPYGLIENVVTLPSFRCQGHGRTVIKELLSTAWKHSCYKVMLMTGSRKESTLAFYESCGFKAQIKKGFVAYPP